MRLFVKGCSIYGEISLPDSPSNPGYVSREWRHQLDHALNILSNGDYCAIVWPEYGEYPTYLPRTGIAQVTYLPPELGEQGWLLTGSARSENVRLDTKFDAHLPVLMWSDSAEIILAQAPHTSSLYISSSRGSFLAMADAGFWIDPIDETTPEDFTVSDRIHEIIANA